MICKVDFAVNTNIYTIYLKGEHDPTILYFQFIKPVNPLRHLYVTLDKDSGFRGLSDRTSSAETASKRHSLMVSRSARTVEQLAF